MQLLAARHAHRVLARKVVRGRTLAAFVVHELGVHVDDSAYIEQAVILDGVEIGAGAELRNVIIDKNVMIPAGYQVGVDPAADRERFADHPGCLVTDEGLVVIGKNETVPV